MISVVVITRNRKSLLLRCLKALSDQTEQPDEVVVVDNNSDDETKAVVLNFIADKPNFKYFICRQIGIPQTRNMGLNATLHDTVAWLDDDCIPKRNWYETIKKNSSLAQKFVLQGGARNPNPHSILSTALFFLNQRNKKNALFSSIKKHKEHKIIGFFDTKNFVINKNHIKKIGHFFNPKHLLAGDLYFQRDLKKNHIDILFLSGIDVDHYYETSPLQYIMKLKWAKKCKQIFKNSSVEKTINYDRAVSIFGDKKINQIYYKFIEEKNSVEKKFLRQVSKHFSPTKNITFKTIIWLSKKYLGEI